MKWRSAVVVAMLAIACSSVRPAPVQIGDRCFRCRSVISETKLAAEILSPEGTPFPFRTSGCLARYLKAHPEDQGAVFVTDYATGRMLPASEAWFVSTTLSQGTLQQSDYLAFRSRRDAQAASVDRAPLLRWTTVVATASAN